MRAFEIHYGHLRILTSGKDMPMQLKPYEPLLIKELEYKNTPQYKRDLEFWQEECKRPEPYFTHMLGPAVLGKSPPQTEKA